MQLFLAHFCLILLANLILLIPFREDSHYQYDMSDDILDKISNFVTQNMPKADDKLNLKTIKDMFTNQ